MTESAPTSTNPRPERFVHNFKVHVLVGLGYALIAFICFAPALTVPTHHVIGQGGPDSLQKMWFLSWTPFAIGHHQQVLYSSAINYPNGINVMWNTGTLFLGVVFAPVTALFGPVVAFNVAMFIAVLASAWCAYWAIGRYVPSRVGSIVGGLIYGFSPYMMGESLGHLTLLTMVFPPIALVLFHEIVVLQRYRWWVLGTLLGVASAAQVFISEEVLASTALVAMVGLAAVAGFNRQHIRARLPYVLRATLVGGGVALLLSGWALLYQFTGPAQVHQTLQGYGAFVTDPLGFFIPTANQFIAPPFLVGITQHFRGNLSEWNAYLGLPLIGLLGWFARRNWKARLVRVATCTAIATTILSFGPYLVLRGHQFPIPLPWLVTQHIPLLKDLLPSRFMACVYLLAGLLVAYGISRIPATSRQTQWGVGITLVAAGMFLVPALPRPTASLPVDTTIPTQVAQDLRTGGVVLFSPYSTENDADALLVQAENDFAFSIPGGYAYAPDLPPITSPSPLAVLDDPASVDVQHAVLADALGRQGARAKLREAHINTLVVLAGPHASQFTAFWTAVLGVRPAVYDGVAVWMHVPTLTGGA
jgi:hypothetical protein